MRLHVVQGGRLPTHPSLKHLLMHTLLLASWHVHTCSLLHMCPKLLSQELAEVLQAAATLGHQSGGRE